MRILQKFNEIYESSRRFFIICVKFGPNSCNFLPNSYKFQPNFVKSSSKFLVTLRWLFNSFAYLLNNPKAQPHCLWTPILMCQKNWATFSPNHGSFITLVLSAENCQKNDNSDFVKISTSLEIMKKACSTLTIRGC